MDDGIMDSGKMIDTLISSCEDAVSAIHMGQHIKFCKIMYEMVVCLANLKQGVLNDMKNREEIIDMLVKRLNDNGIKTERLSINDFLKNGVETVEYLDEKED